MKKIVKKVIALGTMAIVIGSVATTTAFAANKNYSFSVTTSQNDGKAFSAGNAKDDNEQRAYVYTTSGNIISNDLFYMSVYKNPYNENANRVTSWKRVTSNSAKYLLDYTTRRGKGSVNYLCGDTDRLFVSVEGNWWS